MTTDEFIDLQKAIERVRQYFQYDLDKFDIWMNTPNPNLGGAIPWNMIIVDRCKKLTNFINTQLDENGPV